MSCMWIKDGVHFKFNSGQFSGLPTTLPTISILESSGYPLSCPMSCPLYPYMAVVGSLICMAKFPWAAHGQPTPLPTELPTFSYLEVEGCLLSPLSCPLFPYMEEVGSLICMAKFPWATHGQPTPLPTCSPWAAKWAAPLFFPYGISLFLFL